MNAVMMIGIYICNLLQQVTSKDFNKKTGNRGVYAWSMALSLAAAAFFILTSGGKFDFSLKLGLYSLGFASAYSLAVTCHVLALQYGSISLTTLIISYSLIIPTMYGMTFLDETPGGFLVIGLALLAVSLFFINFKKADSAVNGKWLFFSLLTFAGNGMCSTVQKMQQVAFDGACKNELMILAMIISAVIMGIFALLSKEESAIGLRCGWYLAVLFGIVNGALNMLVMLLGEKMAASVMFPLISAGGIVISGILSLFIYKEKLSTMQWIGIVFGLVSIVFLNI